MKHIIENKYGKEIEVDMGRTKAIKIFCTECCGYEYNPIECDIKTCSLWPYRGKSLAGISNPKSI